MLKLACDILWAALIAASVLTLVWALISRGESKHGSWAAFAAISAFFIASIFRDPEINRDILSYVNYSDLARTMSALCYMIGVRMEPPQALMMWATSNISGGHHLYFAAMVAVMIGASALILKVVGPKFALFAALTFPQFAFVSSMATVRWGAALYALAAALVLLDRRHFVWRIAGSGVGVMLHPGVAIAAIAGSLRHWAFRLAFVAAATVAIVYFLPTSELASGSGMRYILALVFSASLLVTTKASLRDDPAYRDHLILVACAAMMSSLYFVSPHLTRFAISLLFVSYLPLVLSTTPVTKNRFSLLTIAAIPMLTLGLEIANPSCNIWHEDSVAGPQDSEIELGAVQYSQSMNVKADLLRWVTGTSVNDCPAE